MSKESERTLKLSSTLSNLLSSVSFGVKVAGDTDKQVKSEDYQELADHYYESVEILRKLVK